MLPGPIIAWLFDLFKRQKRMVFRIGFRFDLIPLAAHRVGQ
jgi:hypothetical protein